MAIIDPEGLYGGERLRSCSSQARLLWPYFFLLCNGFGRFELDLDRIIARAFITFDPVPSRKELEDCLREYIDTYLLFTYRVDGRMWGQWDVPAGTLPRYQNRGDLKSPSPPDAAFSQWRGEYQAKKTLGNAFLSKSAVSTLKTSFSTLKTPISTHREGIGEGIDVGVGKHHSSAAARPEDLTEPPSLETVITPQQPENALAPAVHGKAKNPSITEFETLQNEWFELEFWPAYWRKVDKAEAKKIFRKHATSLEAKDRIVAAVRAQAPQYFRRDTEHRPHASTWLNKRRYEEAPEPYDSGPFNRPPSRSEQSTIEAGLLFEEMQRRRNN